jgi:erythromycin esterase-like protein
LIDYLKRFETHPGRDDPDLKLEAAEVRGYLDAMDRKAAALVKKQETTVMWMIDTPSPFALSSEMLAFLKECEKIKEHDPYGQVRAAMEKVRGYLAEAD